MKWIRWQQHDRINATRSTGPKTHSTGPQTLFFANISVPLLKSIFLEVACILNSGLKFNLWTALPQPIQLVPKPLNGFPNTVYFANISVPVAQIIFFGHRAQSLKSSSVVAAVWEPKTFWEDQRAWRPKNWQLKWLRGPKCWEDKQLEGQKIFDEQKGDKKITHLCRWLNLLKFTRFLGGPNGPKICGGRTKTDFKDRDWQWLTVTDDK